MVEYFINVELFYCGFTCIVLIHFEIFYFFVT